MARTRSTGTAVEPAAGIKPIIQEKSRRRRQAQKTLTSCQQHASGQRNDLLPALHVEYLPIEALRPADRRVRKSTTSQNAKVELSLREFGVCSPILVDSNGTIVHGHVVWEAARRLGLETIPTVRIDHLNQTERRALSIALNRIGETGEWDVEALKVEFEELIDLDQDILATGFDLAEVDALLIEDDADEPEADDVPMVSESQVSQLGDLWLMGEHRLLQGDARDREAYGRLVTEGEGVRLALTTSPLTFRSEDIVPGKRTTENLKLPMASSVAKNLTPSIKTGCGLRLRSSSTVACLRRSSTGAALTSSCRPDANLAWTF